jgi:hypothetical protein
LVVEYETRHSNASPRTLSEREAPSLFCNHPASSSLAVLGTTSSERFISYKDDCSFQFFLPFPPPFTTITTVSLVTKVRHRNNADTFFLVSLVPLPFVSILLSFCSGRSPLLHSCCAQLAMVPASPAAGSSGQDKVSKPVAADAHNGKCMCLSWFAFLTVLSSISDLFFLSAEL